MNILSRMEIDRYKHRSTDVNLLSKMGMETGRQTQTNTDVNVISEVDRYRVQTDPNVPK